MCSFDERGVRKLTIDSKKPFSVIFVVFSGGTVSAVEGAVEGGGESEDEAIAQLQMSVAVRRVRAARLEKSSLHARAVLVCWTWVAGGSGP